MSRLDRSKPSRNGSLRLLIAGVEKHYGAGSPALTLAGKVLSADDVVRLILQDVAASDAADHARAAWITSVQAQTESHRALAPILRALVSTVLARFGDTPDVTDSLADFGLAPRKLTPRTPEAKAAAAAKGRATRAARRTMGKNQKKAFGGSQAE